MTFYRIIPGSVRTPLTALMICASAAALTLPALTLPAHAASKKAPAEETAADTAATETVDIPAGDDAMPPMAQAENKPVEEKKDSDIAPPTASMIAPNVQQWPAVIPPTTNGPGNYSAGAVNASGTMIQDTYVEPIGETHPPLRLTPDKSEIIRLDRPAASVVVGNEAHVSIFIDSPTRLVAVPRQPGASYFTVLDEQGHVIMRRHVLVGSPAEHYVRVRRSCTNTGHTSNCVPTSVYYCPDGLCHPITTQQTPASAPVQPTVMMGSAVTPTSGAGLGQSDDSGTTTMPDGTDFNGMQFMPVIPWPFTTNNNGNSNNSNNDE